MSSVDLNGKTILVTGVAGFIGCNLVKRIYRDHPDAKVIGIDNRDECTQRMFYGIENMIAGVIGYDSIRKHLAECGYHTAEIREKYHLRIVGV